MLIDRRMDSLMMRPLDQMVPVDNNQSQAQAISTLIYVVRMWVCACACAYQGDTSKQSAV